MRYQLYVFMLVSFLLSVTYGSSKIIENKILQCSQNKININICLKELLEDLRPFMSKGIPEVNIPILEPMSFKNISFNQIDGAFELRFHCDNVLVTGFSNYSMKSFNINPDKMELTAHYYVPSLRVSGNYVLTGKIILLPVSGHGPFRATFDGINNRLTSKIILKKEGGKERLGLSNTVFDFQLRSAKGRLRNVFNGDPILSKTVNHFINENHQFILKELKPAIAEDISLLTQLTIGSAMSFLPVDLITQLTD